MLPVVLALAMLATGLAPKRGDEHDRDGFAEDDNAFFEMGMLWTLIGAIVTALVILLALNLLAPDVFVAVADLTATLRNADLNSTLAEGIAEVIGLVLPVGFIISFVAVPFAAFEILRRVRPGRARGRGYG